MVGAPLISVILGIPVGPCVGEMGDIVGKAVEPGTGAAEGTAVGAKISHVSHVERQL